MNFRVASFNVLNLVRPGIRYYEQRPFSEEEHEDKLDWIAQIIKKADPDIVGFQEVFSDSSLQQAVAKAENFAKDASVISPGASSSENEEDGKAIRPKVGLATRFKIVSYKSITNFSNLIDIDLPIQLPDGKEKVIEVPISKFERPPIRAVIQIPHKETNVIVYVAHLKSKRPVYKDDENSNDPVHQALGAMRAQLIRSVEAAALRAMIIEDIKKTRQPLIVLGDLNDIVESISTQIVTGQHPDFRWSSKSKKKYWDVLLYSTNTIQTRQDLKDFGYTHIHRGKRDVLDHILVSQEFYHRNPKRIGKVTYQHILNDHLFDWSLTSREYNRIQSDHGIPVAEIEMDS